MSDKKGFCFDKSLPNFTVRQLSFSKISSTPEGLRKHKFILYQFTYPCTKISFIITIEISE